MQHNLCYLLLLTLALSVQLSSLARPVYNHDEQEQGTISKFDGRAAGLEHGSLTQRRIGEWVKQDQIIQKRLASKAKKKAAKAAKAVVKTVKKAVKGKGKGVQADDLWPDGRNSPPPPPPPPSTAVFVNDLANFKKRLVWKATKEVVKTAAKKVVKKVKKKGKDPSKTGLYKSGPSNMGFVFRKRLVLKATKKAGKAVIDKLKGKKKKTEEEKEEERKKKEEEKKVEVDSLFPQGGGGMGWSRGGQSSNNQ